jgi:hypothetical protein
MFLALLHDGLLLGEANDHHFRFLADEAFRNLGLMPTAKPAINF